jgi:N-acetylglutamate synthase-like GNAT family acetyltransferase
MEPEDFEFAVDLSNTMQWNMTAQDFEVNRQLEPNGCFILQDDSNPAGIATCISYGQVGWFGNLVIKEACRKQGAGTQLVMHAVRYLRNKGTNTIGLYAYPNLTTFYSKLGFKRDIDFVVLKANAVSSSPAPEGNFKAAGLTDFPHIVALDMGCFGAFRTKLFDLILRNPQNVCLVAVEGSEIVGCVVAKVFSETAEVGPLICRKSHPETALKLLKAVLCRVTGAEAYMYLPAAEFALLDAAFKTGFTEQFRLARMFSGPEVAKNCIYMAESLERG